LCSKGLPLYKLFRNCRFIFPTRNKGFSGLKQKNYNAFLKPEALDFKINFLKTKDVNWCLDLINLELLVKKQDEGYVINGKLDVFTLLFGANFKEPKNFKITIKSWNLK
jgi:hypothetical protein